MIEVLRYQTADGQEPVTEWLQSLRDKQAQAKVRMRLKRIEAGNFGDCESVGDCVLELREHLGAGCRVSGLSGSAWTINRYFAVWWIKKDASDGYQDGQGLLG